MLARTNLFCYFLSDNLMEFGTAGRVNGMIALGISIVSYLFDGYFGQFYSWQKFAVERFFLPMLASTDNTDSYDSLNKFARKTKLHQTDIIIL